MAKSGKTTCTRCGSPFVWTEAGAVWAGGLDKESINCPTCGHPNGDVMTSGRIETRPI